MASQASAATLPASTLGVYTGGGDTAEFTSFSKWLGGRPAYALDFLSDESWSTIEQPSWSLAQWSGIGESVVLSVPMLPASGATLAQGASGAYNSYFTTLARALVAGGDGNGILRLGWEMNGNWFPWSIQNGNAANYAAYWRQIVTTMRAVSPGLRFDFTANAGSSTTAGQLLNPEAAYPGDEYVNYIGMDVYDQSWVSNASNAEARWAGYVSESYGLTWQREFAAAHGKPVTFPEWGLDSGGSGTGGGDSPQFIQLMYNWMLSSNMAYQMYFDVDAADGNHELSEYPNAAALYKKLFAPGASSEVTAPTPTPEPTPTQPVKEQPAKEKQTKEQPSRKQPSKEQPAKEQPVKKQPAKEEQPAEEHPAEEHAAKEKSAERPAKEAPVEQPAKELPAKEQPAQGQQPTKEQPVKQQPVKQQPTKQPKTSHEKVTVKRATSTVKAHSAKVRRPRLKVKRIRTKSGRTLVKLSWVAGGERVTVLRDGHTLRGAIHGNSLLVGLESSAPAASYSVCEIATHLCSPLSRVA
jgi:Glycosyl hydrolase family 26